MNTKMNRDEIADELMRGCPDESFDDHEAIAEAIRNGVELEDLLKMPELDRWPDTYSWVLSELEKLGED